MIGDETKEYYDELLTFSLKLASKFTAMEQGGTRETRHHG